MGRILDIVFVRFEEFHRDQSADRVEAAVQPEPGSAGDLQLWLITRFIDALYPGSLSEVNETSQSSAGERVLASSAAKPWEPSRWDPPRGLDMLSGYASSVGVPLVVEQVQHPLTLLIQSVESELRYLRTGAQGEQQSEYSALALPSGSLAGASIGSRDILMPELRAGRVRTEVRVLLVFSRIVGEIIERQRVAMHSADVYADIASYAIADQVEFKPALERLLDRKAEWLASTPHEGRDLRLPFLLLSVQVPEADEYDPAISQPMKDWLLGTLRHLEWRSFVRAHWPDGPVDYGAESFASELGGVGVMIALDRLVSKYELDLIRDAFPTTINRPSACLPWPTTSSGGRSTPRR